MESIKCNVCPHECIKKVGNAGLCGASNKVKIAKICLHEWEEPCISGKDGKKGSGAIFFSNCNMRCVFCQNYEISREGLGKEVEIGELVDLMFNLKSKGALNINLVSPTIYTKQIREALIIAKNKGLDIPIIYNSSGYDKVETLKSLEGLIDVYLPDFKYSNNEISLRYSNVKNYFEVVTEAIKEMKRQQPNNIFDSNDIIQKGLIVRHLILPGHVINSKNVLKWLNENISDIHVSLMAQYFPTNESYKFKNLSRKITKKELKLVENYMYDIGIENGYIQKISDNEQCYVPDFKISEF